MSAEQRSSRSINLRHKIAVCICTRRGAVMLDRFPIYLETQPVWVSFYWAHLGLVVCIYRPATSRITGNLDVRFAGRGL